MLGLAVKILVRFRVGSVGQNYKKKSRVTIFHSVIDFEYFQWSCVLLKQISVQMPTRGY